MMQMMQFENWEYLKSITYCNFVFPIGHCEVAMQSKMKNAMQSMQHYAKRKMQCKRCNLPFSVVLFTIQKNITQRCTEKYKSYTEKTKTLWLSV